MRNFGHFGIKFGHQDTEANGCVAPAAPDRIVFHFFHFGKDFCELELGGPKQTMNRVEEEAVIPT